MCEKHYFPGGNTVIGFYSYYDNIIDLKDAKKIYILKGGPGVGKSTLMKNAARYAINHNMNVSYYHCSSDSDSLDGVLIEETKTLFVDGTSPHMIDPKCPGACDRIVNMGEFLNNENLRKSKNDIMLLNDKIKFSYDNAYKYLNAIIPIYEGINNRYKRNLNLPLILKEAEKISDEILNLRCGKDTKSRKLFLSSITPDGIISYKNETLHAKNTYIINEKIGDLSGILIDKIKDALIRKGISFESYYSPFDPENKISHLYIKNADSAVISSNDFSKYKGEGKIIDAAPYESYEYQDKNEEDRKLINFLIKKAVKDMKKAKEYHDKLERYYIESMNFEKLNNLSYNIIKSAF